MRFVEREIERCRDESDRGTRASDTSFIIKGLCGGVQPEFVNRKRVFFVRGD